MQSATYPDHLIAREIRLAEGVQLLDALGQVDEALHGARVAFVSCMQARRYVMGLVRCPLKFDFLVALSAWNQIW